MKKYLGVLAILVMSLALTVPHAAAADKPAATDLEKVQAYVGPSVVNLQISWTAYVYDSVNRMVLKNVTGDGALQEFTMTSQCTGYVVNPSGYIATAGHCVNPNDVRVAFYEQGAVWAAKCGCYYQDTSLSAQDIMAFSENWTLKHYNADSDSVRNGALRNKVQAAWSVSAGGVEVGKALPARVIKYQSFSDGDGALLKVNATDLPALPMVEGEPEIGSEVVAIGFPGSVDQVTDPDLEPSYKEGSIGSKSSEDGGLTSVYEISAATSGGMSGGPIVNTQGEVLGFVDFKNANETQAFNFMRPISTIKELAVPGSENVLDDSAKGYRTGLDAYFAGEKAAAVKNLSAVVEAQPTNKFAVKYLDLAKKLPDPPAPKKSGFPILPIAIGLAALVLVGGVVALLLLRRRRSAKPGAGSAAGMPNAGPWAPPEGGSTAGPPPFQSAPQAQPAQQFQSAPQVQSAPLAAPGQPAPAVPGGQPAQTTQPTPVGFAAPLPTQRTELTPEEAATQVTPVSSAAPSGAVDASPVNAFCGQCGTRQEAGDRFCGSCGSEL